MSLNCGEDADDEATGGTHATACGIEAVCGAGSTAASTRRRQRVRESAINAD
jgi:hypothetical protein